MCGKFCLVLLLAVIDGIILSMIEVDAQSTVDDSASCESSTFNEAVNLIREDMDDVKNLLGSVQQQNSVSNIKKDLEDLKAAVSACVSNQQPPSTANVSSLCEYKLRARLNALVAAVGV